MSHVRIGQLARSMGSSEKTLRYYDHIGLLRADGRTAAGYRMYAESAVERLRFIRRAGDLGLTLSDIRSILDISDEGCAPCPQVRELIERHISRIDAELRSLRELRRELVAARSRVDRALRSGAVAPAQGCGSLAR